MPSHVTTAAGASGRATRPLRAVADALMADIGRILHGYVARLRNDPEAPSARATDEAHLEDHLASFLADVASTIRSLDEVEPSQGGEPLASALDGSDIQRVVSERHGAQRARLGWSQDEVRREFTVLTEEIAAAVRRRAPAFLYAPTTEARRAEAESSLALLKQFLASAEQLSLASHARVSAELANQRH